MSSSYDSSSIESFNVKDKLKSAASTTGSAIKKGGSAVAKGAKKVGGFFGGWIRWLFYGGIAILAIFFILKLMQMFG
jgi:hypothetical protein